MLTSNLMGVTCATSRSSALESDQKAAQTLTHATLTCVEGFTPGGATTWMRPIGHFLGPLLPDLSECVAVPVTE